MTLTFFDVTDPARRHRLDALIAFLAKRSKTKPRTTKRFGRNGS